MRSRLGSAGLRAYWLARTEGTLTIRSAAQLCARLGLEPAALYGPAWPAHQPAIPPAAEDRARWRLLPAGPVLEALESYCRRRGISEQMALGGEHSALRRKVERARAAGTVTLQAAEALCDRIGVHPYELWQNAYDAAALEGLPEDFDVWSGVA
jgi:hypothetical protein